jgi:hypothetical protein
MEGRLIFDSTSGLLHGVVEDLINNLFDSPAPVSNVVAAVAGGQGSAEPALYIAAAITFSAANAGNIGTLLSLELLDT